MSAGIPSTSSRQTASSYASSARGSDSMSSKRSPDSSSPATGSLNPRAARSAPTRQWT